MPAAIYNISSTRKLGETAPQTRLTNPTTPHPPRQPMTHHGRPPEDAPKSHANPPSNHDWRASFHGGHSWPFCDHATGSLDDILDAAASQRMAAYGVTEHAPRLDERFLYPDERKWGWDVRTLEEKFQEYFETLDTLIARYRGDLEILRGFESEVVPRSEYAAIYQEYRTRYAVDYIVGSVHHVGEISIDSFEPDFREALNAFGGLEPLAIAYYETLAEMVAALTPEIVGHFDLIRKFGTRFGDCETPAIRSAARTALQEIKLRGGILDLNTAGYRKNLGSPYPAPWVIQEAVKIGIPFALGDDSHKAEEVGAHFDDARLYLLAHGVKSLTTLRKSDEGVRQVIASIELTEEEQERRQWRRK